MNEPKTASVFLAGECPDLWQGDCHVSGKLIAAVDGGYAHTRRLGLKASILLGDFDSLDPNLYQDAVSSGIEIIRWPRYKDNTDGDLACAELYNRGYRFIYIFGALGGSRFDHALGNIGLLGLWKLKGLRLVILQGSLRIEVLSDEHYYFNGNQGDMVSLYPLSPVVNNVSVRGFQYPLDRDTLRFGESRTLSNRIVSDTAEISSGEGLLLLMHYRFRW